MMLGLGIVLAVIGLLMIAKPSVVWTLTESWKTNDGTEPSSLYIGSTRFGGIMVCLAGIGSGIVHFL